MLGALAIATATGVSTGTALAEDACSPSFISGSSYLSRICGVPDYDQRRVAATLQGDGRSITVGPSLLGDGSCHCVPTSFTDLLGYYIQNGVKGAFPPKFDWEGAVQATSHVRASLPRATSTVSRSPPPSARRTTRQRSRSARSDPRSR